MRVRKGTRKDFPDIMRLWLKSFAKGNTPKIAKEYLNERLERNEILVAVEGSKVIGFLTFSKNYFLNSDFSQFLAVNKKYRNKGIGTGLMKEFEKQASGRKCRRVFSSVEPWNRNALRFHKKLGYERCGYIDNIWKEGSRDLFFSKKL